MNSQEAFVRTPVSVLHDAELSDGAFRLFLEIYGLSQIGNKGYCWATNKTFAETFGRSTRSIIRALIELEKRGYIRKEEVQNANTKEVVERRIYPVTKMSHPTDKNVTPPMTEMSQPPCQICHTPRDKNVTDNNNNTIETSIEHTIERVCYPDTFETLWKEYPRKANKRGAFKAYETRLNEGANEDDLMRAVTNYNRTCKDKNTEERYIMHGATFFGPNRRYEDYLKYEPPQAKNESKPISRLVFEGDDLPFG